MAYTVLARKYRSATFDDVVAQDHVAQTLKRAIESGRIAQAFLFCGTRGTGKTSMARILAKSLNCLKAKGPTTEPCLECDSCKAIARGEDIDVIEIDAASNTQVEKTREVILDNAAYRPARSRYKIYIIDEVHMLSKASFNALLKTLEEPPEHVKFILATTEPEKVLQTIQSRCQRYDFRSIPTREIADHLAEICKSEQIDAQADAVLLVAKAGAGSMRDALSVLDRLLSLGEKKLDVEMVEQLLGLPKVQLIFDLADAIGRGDVKTVLEQSAGMISRGMSADSLIASLSDHLRNLLIIRTCGMESHLVEVPGLSPRQLTEQAEKYGVVNLTQDITILEELRRTMRQSQAGRALLDATLVRLALAEQFIPISEAMTGLDKVAGEAQKKNGPDRARNAPQMNAGVADGSDDRSNAQAGVVAAFAAPPEMKPPVESKPGPAIADPITHGVAEHRSQEASVAAPVVDTASSPASVANGAPLMAEPAAGGVPVVSAPPSLDFEDEDDDLPRPGKVWDNGGPSLSELLGRKKAPAPGEAARDPSFVNIEPVGAMDLSGAWQELMGEMKSQQGLVGLLANASLARVEDEQAVIRLSAGFGWMVSMFDKRRGLLCQSLSRILGKPVGVRFEVDREATAPAGAAADIPAAPTPAPAAAPTLRAPAPPARPIVVAEPVQQAGIRITPDLVEQMRKEPLLAQLMDQFAATPVKVE